MVAVKRTCLECRNIFSIDDKFLRYGEKVGRLSGSFCSSECYYKHNTLAKTVPCTTCKNTLTRKLSQAKRSKSGNLFCSKSCAAIYNNRHKTKGTRRSKLEVFILEEIQKTYPQLTVVTNQISVINYELDFYFPDLKLAIEINGIFHREPIYGAEKLAKIQANDRDKIHLCKAAGITLIQYEDISSRFTPKSGMETWLVLDKIIRKNTYKEINW